MQSSYRQGFTTGRCQHVLTVSKKSNMHHVVLLESVVYMAKLLAYTVLQCHHFLTVNSGFM
jgi:hypothetical protein